jgi:hypothetical protein
MSRSLLLMLCLVIGLLVLACGSPDTNKNGPANISGATAAATGDQIGVPECDSFLTAYENCVTTKVPEQARPTFQTTMTRWRTDWKKLAADPATRAQLVTACKTHLENARTTMKAYNCTF